jgi:hypothetical protein
MQPPPLLAYLAEQVRAPIVRKGVFAGEYVLFGDYMPSSLFLFETSAVLGYTYRDRLAPFVSLFCQPGQERDLIAHMARDIEAKLAALGKEPKDFMELHFIPEATRFMQVFRGAGLTTYSEWIDFPKLAKQKMRPADIWSQLQFMAAQGVAFGYSQPELAQKLFVYEDDPQEWQDARSNGLDIPASPPKAMSIHQRQAEALGLIRPYVVKARPDLLKTLGL